MEQRFSKDLSSLDNIFTFIDGIIDDKVRDKSVFFSIHLVVEELFTNMVKYNPETNHNVLIVANWRNNDLIISLTDFDVEPFDITKAGDINVDEGLANRQVGGLGLHLVRKMVDEINYQYKDNNSTITVIKHLES